MAEFRLTLGLDLSTQSLSAVVIDADNAAVVFTHALDYAKDTRLNCFGIDQRSYLVPPRVEGEADQPPAMFFAALDAMFSDMKEAGVDLSKIVALNTSGQQHGHVYLNYQAHDIFSLLNEEKSTQLDLVCLLTGCFAYELAPIWMTANTREQASFVRNYVGGKERMIELSGSDAPLRFTGAVMRRVAQQFPEAYKATKNIQLISNMLSAVLTGNSYTPLDFGNGCGISLMDYRCKEWSPELLQATADGLPGGEKALRSKLPDIVAPDTIVGNIARYFVVKYGFNPSCQVIVGSGDNPQSKVLVAGDLLSLGTSFVNMVATDGNTLDSNGFANAMYDGIGRPFMFGCRTNGAMVWDQLRALYGMAKEDYAPAEDFLRSEPVGQHIVLWQPRSESFPPSSSFALTRIGNNTPTLGTDYAGLVEATLTTVYHHSRGFALETIEPLYVTGGATASPSIMLRIAAIWNRPVVPVEKGGAALGAAVAAAYTFFKQTEEKRDTEQLSASLLKRCKPVLPKPKDVTAVHGSGGYLERFTTEEAKLIKMHLVK